MFGFSRWRHRHLLAAWVAYWAALVAVRLGGAVASVLAVSGPNGHGSASAGFGNNGVTFTVVKGTATVWAGASSFAAIALWVAGPPLVLWVVWMLSRPRRGVTVAGAEATPLRMHDDLTRLPPAPESFGAGQRGDKVPARRPHDQRNG